MEKLSPSKSLQMQSQLDHEIQVKEESDVINEYQTPEKPRLSHFDEL